MNPRAADLWKRAREALGVARKMEESPDHSAATAYYAAFYAVSAYFALEGREFKTHKAVELALHRELILLGKLPQEVGQDFRRLSQARQTGHYGGNEHVSREEAEDSLECAKAVFSAIEGILPPGFDDKGEP